MKQLQLTNNNSEPNQSKHASSKDLASPQLAGEPFQSGACSPLHLPNRSKEVSKSMPQSANSNQKHRKYNGVPSGMNNQAKAFQYDFNSEKKRMNSTQAQNKI
jgi:hypothetical protein